MSQEKSYPKNESFSIIRDKDGNYKRVLVQQKVKDIEPVLVLQRSVSKINPNFEPEKPEKLHMTLVHFGVPEELYEDFRKANPNLTFNKFLDQFLKLLQKIEPVVTEELTVDAEKLDILGESPHHVIVIKIVKVPAIMKSRKVIIQALHQFIRDLDVADVDQFISQSPNLKYNPADVYRPHITLGHVGENTTLPQIDISDSKIALKSSNVSGVKKV